MPDGTDPGVAALIGCCVTTGVGAVLKTAAVPAGSSVAVIGLGGVGLSCVMGAVVAGASRIVAIDRVASKLATAERVGATDTLLADDDAVATVEALRDLTDGGPDFVFEAIGRSPTAELAIAALPVGGTAVLVGMTPMGARASFEVYPFVDGSRRILGSNYGFAEPAVDFPTYAAWWQDGRLPFDRLIDRRIGLDDLEDAFAAMRRGEYTRQVIGFGGGSAGAERSRLHSRSRSRSRCGQRHQTCPADTTPRPVMPFGRIALGARRIALGRASVADETDPATTR